MVVSCWIYLFNLIIDLLLHDSDLNLGHFRAEIQAGTCLTCLFSQRDPWLSCFLFE